MEDWTAPLGDRASAVRRYKEGPRARVLYATNIDDWHNEQHFVPFRDSLLSSWSEEHLRIWEYEDGRLHRPPPKEVFLAALDEALAWE